MFTCIPSILHLARTRGSVALVCRLHLDFLPSSPLQVVYNVGLCICLYDITKLDDSYIFPGDGAAHTKGMTI